MECSATHQTNAIDWQTMAVLVAILIATIKAAWTLRGIRDHAERGTAAAEQTAADMRVMRGDFHLLKDQVLRHGYELDKHGDEIDRIKKKLPPSDKYSVET